MGISEKIALRFMKLVLSFSLLLVTLQSLCGADLSDLSWSTLNDEVEITFCNPAASGSLNIPATIDNLPVTSIGDAAFQYCNQLVSIVLPDSVTSIGSEAFSWCEKLTHINLPEGITAIEEATFSQCLVLNNVVLPSTLTRVADRAFSGCHVLAVMTVPSGVTEIGDGAFEHCFGLTSISIPESVATIAPGAFQSCSSLGSIAFPEGLTSIAPICLYGCTQLTSVVLPDSITAIGNHAFAFCSNLTSIVIPANVASIGDFAFQSCQELDSIYFDGAAPSVGQYPFSVPPDAQALVTLQHANSFGFQEPFEQYQSWNDLVLQLRDDVAYYNVIGGAHLNGGISGFDLYEEEATANLTATPAAGYVFVHWTGDASGNNNPLNLTVNDDKTVGAVFIEQSAYDAVFALGESTQLAAIESAPSDFDLYNFSQLQALAVGPSISVNPDETFTLTLEVTRSLDLESFLPFDLQGSSATINADGHIEVNFSSPDDPDAAIFQLQSD